MTLGSLAIPAAALADGAIDPNFHGTGYHFGTAADLLAPTDGIVLAGSVTRVGTVVQADGRIVVGGQSSDGFMTLVRYNLDGSLDTSFNAGTGIVKRQFSGTPAGLVGTSGATALTQDASGNIYVAGFGGSQSEFVARFTSAGAYTSSAVCYAPHLIDYTARALALRPNGSVVIAGYARDRHLAILDLTGLTPPTVYGQRAVVTLPASGNSTTACGAYADEQGSAGVMVDGVSHTGVVTDATLSGRWYEGVASLANNSYVVVSTNGTTVGNDAGAWVERFTAAGALDGTFNALGAVHGRVSIANANLHAVTIQPSDGTVYAAGEAGGSLLLARITGAGVLATLSPFTVASGGNTGQAVVLQADGKVLVGGGATGGGSAFALALARFTATGAVDDSFGNAGQVITGIGSNAYITALGMNGNTIGVAGRVTTSAGFVSVAARYYAIGDPPPVPVVVPPVVPVVPVTTPVTTPGTTPVRVTTTTTTTTTPTITVKKTVKKAAKKICTVPKVTGKKLNKARIAVYAKGCKVRVKYVASKKANNTVLRQSRKAGKKIGYRSVVKLTVAKKAAAVAKDKKSS